MDIYNNMIDDIINEAIRPKGQEYRKLSKVVDKDGNIVGKDYADGEKMATTSLGKGGVLDSVAQHHIEDLDVQKEKVILESKDIINEYMLYLGGQFQRAASQYSDSSKSQLEKRMFEDLSELQHTLGIDAKKASDLVCGEYFGLNNLGVDLGKLDNETLSKEEIKKAEKAIRTVLRMRINYVNKMTSLIAQMVKTNYKVLGLTEEQAKEYIDKLNSGTNDAVKSVGEIKELIKKNTDKFMINNGEAIDLRSLGFGVILGPSEGYKLDFAGTDGSNKEGMLTLLQKAMRYDVVVVAHGGDSEYGDNDDNYVLLNKKTRHLRKNIDNLEDSIHDISSDIYYENKKMDQFVIFYQKDAEKINIAINDIFLKVENLKEDEIDKIIKDRSRNLSDKYFDSIHKMAIKYATEDSEETIRELESRLKLINSDNIKKSIEEEKKVLDNIKGNFEKFKDKFKEILENSIHIKIINGIIEKNEYKKKMHIWVCQPTKTLNAGPFEDVNELVRQLIKEGFKKILIEDCNPGGHKLADDIMKTKGVLINHSDFSNYVESSLIDSNDEFLVSIEESEASLKAFAESYGIDYNDDEYLEECCNWYLENQEAINEGEFIESLKEFFRKIITGIIGFLKKIFEYIKKAFFAIKYIFSGNEEKPKNTKAKFNKPLKFKLLNVKDAKIDEHIAENREQAQAIGSKNLEDAKEVIDKMNKNNNSFSKKAQQDINELEKKASKINESAGGVDFMLKFLMEDVDLFDDSLDNILHEFETNDGTEEETDEEDFSMDDEGEGASAETNEEPPAEGDEGGEKEFSMDDDEGASADDGEQPDEANEPPADEGEEEEFSMDDEGEGATADEGEASADDGEGASADDGEENFELPDDDEGEEGASAQDSGEGGEEEFSMDDDGGDGATADDGEGASADDSEGASADDGESSGDDETDSKLKELESIVFDDLSEDEKNMKITELKALYITVYKKCGTISDMLAGIKRDEETIQIVEYISNTLIDLKEYVNDYINKVFDSKTYIENLAQLQKYIMIFNAIHKVFDQIKSENEE